MTFVAQFILLKRIKANIYRRTVHNLLTLFPLDFYFKMSKVQKVPLINECCQTFTWVHSLVPLWSKLSAND